MRTRNRFFFIVALFFLTFNACDNTDLTPAFIEISEEVILNSVDMTNFNLEHETSFDSYALAAIASHSFKDVWVYANGNKLGLWEIPCKIPVLESDSVLIRIVPGVRMNGMSTTIPAYPFLEAYNKKIYMAKGSTYPLDNYNIKFKYYNTTKFELVESFEQSTTFSSNINNGGNFVIYNENGENVGLILLQDSLYSFEVVSPSKKLPGRNNSVFFEMDYKCDEEMAVGLIMVTSSGVSTHEPLVNVRSTNGKWKKIYINLTQSLSRNATSDGYVSDAKIVISGNRLDNTENAKFYIDNAKIVYNQ